MEIRFLFFYINNFLCRFNHENKYLNTPTVHAHLQFGDPHQGGLFRRRFHQLEWVFREEVTVHMRSEANPVDVGTGILILLEIEI